MSGFTMSDKSLLCQQYLDILYRDVDGHEAAHDRKDSPVAETYGEIYSASIAKLIAAIPFQENDVFVDYGSGVGKIVAQVFLSSSVKEAIGIELLPKLHGQAKEARERIARELPDFYQNDRKISFVEGDFLQTRFQHATIALICAPCFTQSVLNALGEVLDATPSIHTIFTLRPIEAIKRLRFKKAIRIEGSWDSTLCYVYQR